MALPYLGLTAESIVKICYTVKMRHSEKTVKLDNLIGTATKM